MIIIVIITITIIVFITFILLFFFFFEKLNSQDEAASLLLSFNFLFFFFCLLGCSFFFFFCSNDSDPRKTHIYLGLSGFLNCKSQIKLENFPQGGEPCERSRNQYEAFVGLTPLSLSTLPFSNFYFTPLQVICNCTSISLSISSQQ